MSSERIRELELERDHYAQQYAELLILQQVFTAITSSMELEDILGMVLRGICEALGFGRVAIADVLMGELRLVACTGFENGVRFVPPTAKLEDLLNRRLELHVGDPGDGIAPLADPCGPYVVLPLIVRDRLCGVLYVDTPPEPEITTMRLQSLFDFAAQAAIVIENARLYAQTRILASTDPLTGVINRRVLFEQLDREISNATRYGTNLAFMMLDLDDLKKINDGQGHRAGDDALRSFAGALRHAARRGDMVARFGGDEFAVVMIRADKAAAEIAGNRIYRTVRTAGLSCSGGIAVFPGCGTTSDALYKAADAATYVSKKNGKARYTFAPESA